MTRHRANDTRYPFPAIAAGLIVGAGVAGALFMLGLPIPVVVVVAGGAAMFLVSSIKYADQWEKAVLMRLGRYTGLRGPGYFLVVPILARSTRIVFRLHRRLQRSNKCVYDSS